MTQLLNYKVTEPEVKKHDVPILLMHGLFGDMNNLGMIARGLDEYTTIQIDARNHGESFQSDEMNYDVMAMDIVNLLAHLNIEKVILLGHSMGGKAVINVTKLIPDKIDKLIIIDVAPVAYHERRHDEILATLKAVSASGITNRRTATELMREYITEGDFVIQFLLKSFRNGEFRFNVPVLDEKYENITGWNPIPTWTGKAFFIIGGDSSYVKKEYQEAVQAQLPNASAIIIAGAGHWVHAQKTELVIKAILSFLDKNPS